MRNENAAMSEKGQRKLDSVCNCVCVGSCDLNHLMDGGALTATLRRTATIRLALAAGRG